MVRILAIIFGIIFIFIGVAGFFPEAYSQGLLFGFYLVGFIQNIIHIVTGVLAIMAATTYPSSRFFFKIFGIVYLVIAGIGFFRNGDVYFFAINTADMILYLILAIIAFYLGFFTRDARY